MKETEDVQNTIARMLKEIYLNVPNPTTKLKRQYTKVQNLLNTTRSELDTLNDMKEEFKRINR